MKISVILRSPILPLRVFIREVKASTTQQEARNKLARNVPQDRYLIEAALTGIPACSLPISSQKSSSIKRIAVHPHVEFSKGFGENIGNAVLYLDLNLTDFLCHLKQIT